MSLSLAASTTSCGASQIACPTSLGTGCCAVGYTCTVVTSQLFCAQATAVVVAHSSNKGLAAGAKIGIAVGVVIGAAAVIGGATWVCLHQRRRRQSSAGSRSQNPSAYDPYEVSHSDGQPGGGGGYLPVGPSHNTTQISSVAESPVRSWRRQLHLRRHTPSGSTSNAPRSGPSGGPAGTDSIHTQLTGAGGMEMFPHGAGAAHGAAHGVPITPQAPNDIVAPVEIDSTAVAHTESVGGAAAEAHDYFLDPNNEKGHLERAAYTPVPQASTHLPPYRPADLPANMIGEHFELAGSEVQPTQQPVPGASTTSGTAAAQMDESPIIPRFSGPGLPASLPPSTSQAAQLQSQTQASVPSSTGDSLDPHPHHIQTPLP